MFNTKHLEGRIVYETDNVVCINVFVKADYTSDRNEIFMTQLLVSLVVRSISFLPSSISIANLVLSEEDFKKELYAGVRQYLKTRKILGLKIPNRKQRSSIKLPRNYFRKIKEL